ncbi:hypothetical protein [Pseudoalteromonas sp. S16_S37]|uniref:hypothetical protein n=1 Tax=Pseudoalteromonas sp. S16_S37 TaxID=2720228 RepID=UPI0016805E14|nr:hypothetical protein [Pseudoalteromonas sp. S16_S37]MBD1580771.1 hypothetical protein [Pseudoalteromonas sp. S16_S37]
MNEVLYYLGYFFNTIVFCIVLFWMKKFYSKRWKLFFGPKKDLATVQEHELYSNFLTAFCFLVFLLISFQLELFLLSLEMDLVEKIKLFYTSMVIVQFSWLLTLFCLHLVRGCTFSSAARICTYSTIVVMMLLGMQLISRGYFDYHELSIIYKVGLWICKVIILTALVTYPIRSIKDYFKQKRAAAS